MKYATKQSNGRHPLQTYRRTFLTEGYFHICSLYSGESETDGARKKNESATSKFVVECFPGPCHGCSAFSFLSRQIDVAERHARDRQALRSRKKSSSSSSLSLSLSLSACVNKLFSPVSIVTFARSLNIHMIFVMREFSTEWKLPNSISCFLTI